MGTIRRLYVEKQKAFGVREKELLHDIHDYLDITGVKDVRILIRYDIENLSDDTYKKALGTIFYEPSTDFFYEETFDAKGGDVFSIEYLPGQFDQRADSAVQCIQLLNEEEKPTIFTAVTYVLYGALSKDEVESVKNYCMNPVDSRQAKEAKPDTLKTSFDVLEEIPVLEGFIELDVNQQEGSGKLKDYYTHLGLAMTLDDFLHIHTYFKEVEKRNPTETEVRVLDTYWSDHCRHTTFSTELKNITLEDGYYKESIQNTLNDYLSTHEQMFGGDEKHFICLMDLALMAMRRLKKEGKLKDLEESEEINACSIVVPVEIDNKTEEWIVSFKNETHNHPTEIEPFGGAATCLGGAIRDPLSGRSYVYQAMRVTGAGDPTVSLKDTLKGKLPQKKLVLKAADGYSSYGNQIGLSTGYVKEIYHPSYVAKRLEIGAVMGAAPREHIVRKSSDVDDVIILLGGRTGRDGIGGATGSSKIHTESSIETCGAEVQKGNPPTERKIQRLFRRKEVSKLIKKCNDFGAGGVAVAIGELAEGLTIWLDQVPKKYEGLNGTELAISESQERMAVVLDPKDVDEFLVYANEENLEAVKAAVVTEEPRLVMEWKGKEIVNISRAFLDTNGAHQETSVCVEIPDASAKYFDTITDEVIGQYLKNQDVKSAWIHTLSDLNVCSQKGLVEMFDSSIGAGNVLMPYGGKYQMSEIQTMVSKIPVLKGNTNAVSMMSYGFDPYLSSYSPYHGAAYAVLMSVAKIVATGGDYRSIRFTFQEYFKRMTKDAKSWGQPVSALLGAYHAQMGFELPSIGGKDSMSGTFQELNVAPTLVSFAVNMGKQEDIISPELKGEGNVLVQFNMKKDAYDMPDYDHIKKLYHLVHSLIQSKAVISCYAMDGKGIVPALSKMSFGNCLGVTIDEKIKEKELFTEAFGSLLAEVNQETLQEVQKQIEDAAMSDAFKIIGVINNRGEFVYGDMVLPVWEALNCWKKPLNTVFKTKSKKPNEKEKKPSLYLSGNGHVCSRKCKNPTVFIPVFPGTNCEYDSMKAFEEAGANVVTRVFKNLTPSDIRESVNEFAKEIQKSQIIMFPGGFSAGDEPDGSGKFFAAAFRNERIKEEVHNLLQKRDGLILGICNGFQALIKLGLLPYGEITQKKNDDPALTYNLIGRHVSKMVYTKVVSNKSPWLLNAHIGGDYVIPASHGEGRFIATKPWIDRLFEHGQVATQYVDLNGNMSMDDEYNINGSFHAIEGITSPDGRVFGKMGHAERIGKGVAMNIFGEQDMKIFASGVEYFK